MNLLGAIIAQSSLRFKGRGNANGIGSALGRFPPLGVANGIGGAAGVFAAATAGRADGLGGAIGARPSLGQAAGIGAAAARLADMLNGHADGVGAAIAIRPPIGNADGVGAASTIIPGPEARAFLARTSGLDSNHVRAYTVLINGLVSDGIWSLLDVLYIFATQNSTNALLNLVSSSFTGVANGSPAFVADRGYTGVDASSTVYINSQFNPTTAPSPNFTTNSCHLSAWADTGVTPSSTGGILVGGGGASTDQSHIMGHFSDGKSYFRINDATSSAGFPGSNSIGHWTASRTGASASAGYRNGVVVGSPNAPAGTLQNANMAVLAYGQTATITFGSAAQVTMASIGAGLNATQAANLYARLRAYMTAVGVNEATAFLARTSGLDATHITAYTNLINGLVADGVWQLLDALYVFATQNSATALLNLVSTSYPITVHGAPTFTADQGYAGASGSTTVYLDSGFNPAAAAAGAFVQNSAHISCWSNLDIGGGAGAQEAAIGGAAASNTPSDIYPRFNDGKAYYRINDINSGPSAGVTTANAIGHYLANRSGASAQQGYKNGVDQGVVSVTSGATTGANIFILGFNSAGGSIQGFSGQLSAASIGGSLTGTQVTALYNRLSAYRTAIGLT